jgi:hypothetical protein
MSLKNVHVLFIVTACVMVLSCGLLALDAFRAGGSPLLVAAAGVAVAVVVFLVRYETQFLRRCRQAGIR